MDIDEDIFLAEQMILKSLRSNKINNKEFDILNHLCFIIRRQEEKINQLEEINSVQNMLNNKILTLLGEVGNV